MGILFSIPLAGALGTVASSCLAGFAFCFTSTAGEYCHIYDFQLLNANFLCEASMFFKSCNCNSSIATRVGFAVRLKLLSQCSFGGSLICLTDNLLFELDARMVDEDPARHQADREMESRLLGDGLCWRQMLRRACGEYYSHTGCICSDDRV